MSHNSLEVNVPRIGWYYDGLPNDVTPPTATMLQDDGNAITLRIPFHPEEKFGVVERWFSGRDTQFDDDPDRTQFQYDPPTSLLFQDPAGMVALFGCQSMGFRSQIPGVGEGRLLVEAAVFGADSVAFERPNRVRTYIPGMGEWAGLSAIRTYPVRDSQGALERLEVHASRVEPIELAHNAILATSWLLEQKNRDNEARLVDPPFLETLSEAGNDFREHLTAHTRLRDLVDLAYWRPTGYRRMQFRLEDPEVGSGDPHWREVRTYSVRGQHEPHKDPPMFSFGHFGVEGYRQWARLHDKFSRAINPLMGLLDIESSTVESQFLQSCIGLEGLGVQLARDAGEPGREALEQSLDRVIRDSSVSFSSGWAEKTSKLYNDIKHYDRDQVVDPVITYNALRENELVFRVWAGLRIGIDRKTLITGAERSRSGQALLRQGLVTIPE